QKIFRAVCSSKRPVIFFPPVIHAHHKKFDWLPGEFVFYSLEKVVVPIESGFLFIEGRGGAEINVSDFLPVASVATDDYQEVLFLTGIFTTVRLNTDVVAQ